MASLKRFKQPSDHNSRSQDIPPRFKRQKSFTSSKPQAIMESENQNNQHSQNNKKSTWGDSFTSTWASSNQKGFSTPREGRKIVKKLSTQKAQLNAEKTLLKPPTSQAFVLSPMENKLFSLNRNDAETENSNFGNISHQNCSKLNNHFSIHTSTQQSLSQSDSYNNNGSTKGYYHVGQNSPNSFNWCESNPANSQFDSNMMQQNYSPTQSPGPSVDYSDPDIRTIEMLRELERVADQTDVGSDETANDKNSLVSHHLRMLMCAVDRYTQGVEEDLSDTSREDETLPQEDVSSPSPAKTPIKDSSLNQKQSQQFSPLSNSQISSFNSFQNNASCYQFSPTAGQPAVINYPSQPMENNMLNPWNLWTSPTFNSLDVYASNNLPDVHNASHPSMFMSFAGDRCY